jgi:eukaryotic-like serine/threonine-protein kinase
VPSAVKVPPQCGPKLSGVTLGSGLRLAGRYRLDVRIGAGGMGEVWRGTDEVLGRTVAVKVMLPGVAADPGFAQRFLTEATAMARVSHPAVASIHDYGTDAGVTFLVMEYVDGESLAGLLARVGRLGPADTMRVIAQAADGLQAVHAAGLVHRDIKPANLLIHRDGRVLVTDFGISRHEDASRLTASGAILGTPSYLSPEQVLGEPVGPLTDVYALGLTAYECLAGQKPFQAENPYAVAIMRLRQAPRPIEVALPPAVRTVVEGAMAVDPGRRWPSAAALAEAARAAGSGVTPPVTAARARSRVPMFVAFLVVLLAGAGIAVWGATRGDGTTPDRAAPAGTAPAQPAVPAGFRTCGTELCPAEPMCWHGITDIAGRVIPPKRADCAVPHYMQTFAAIPLPADVDLLDVDLNSLSKRADVKAACAPAIMRARSTDRDATAGWTIEAWPIPTPVGGTTSYLHCVAGKGETTGSVF